MFNQLANRTQLSIDALMRLLEELPAQTSPTAPALPSPNHTATEPATHTTTEPNHTNQNDESRFIESQPYDGYYYGEESAPSARLSSDWHSDQNTSAKHDTPTSQHQLTRQALSLLLFQPKLSLEANDIDSLRDSREENLVLLINLIDLLQQRPEFTSGQIIGYWQGTYGAEASKTLQTLINQSDVFHHAQELTQEKEKHSFDPKEEFCDALNLLQQQQQQQDCDAIIQQLNNKPTNQWSDAEKQLYRKAIAARAN
jgi:DNA primase